MDSARSNEAATPGAEPKSRVELARDLIRLAKAYEKAQAKSEAASRARAALPPGSSRARVTTANARWAQAAEARDRRQEQFLDLCARIAKESGR